MNFHARSTMQTYTSGFNVLRNCALSNHNEEIKYLVHQISLCLKKQSDSDIFFTDETTWSLR